MEKGQKLSQDGQDIRDMQKGCSKIRRATRKLETKQYVVVEAEINALRNMEINYELDVNEELALEDVRDRITSNWKMELEMMEINGLNMDSVKKELKQQYKHLLEMEKVQVMIEKEATCNVYNTIKEAKVMFKK